MMSGDAADRLERLERQVEDLRREVRELRDLLEPETEPEPVAPLPASPPPAPEARRPGDIKAPVPRGASKPARDVESFVGLAILGRVGIGAVVLAAVYFGQMGWTQFGPVGRVVSIYALGALIVVAGFALRARVARSYVAYLFGGGTALTYVAGVFAHLRYDMLGDAGALAALLASAALGQGLALWIGLEAMATLALGAAFAAPFLVQSPAESPVGLFALALVLHSWAAFVERTFGWHRARAVGVVGAVACGLAWYGSHTPVPSVGAICEVELLIVGVVLPDLLAAWQRVPAAAWRHHLLAAGLGVAEAAVFLFFGTGMPGTRGFGVVAAAALMGVGAALRVRGPRAGTGLARAGSLLLPLGAMVFAFQQCVVWGIAEERWHVMTALALAAVALIGVRRWTGVADAGAVVSLVMATLPVAFEERASSAAEVGFVALAAVPGLALLILGRTWLGPAVGAGGAAYLMLRGLWPAGGLAATNGGYASLALVLAAAVGVGAILRSAQAASRVLRTTGAAILCTVAVVWSVAAFSVEQGEVALVGTWPFLNWRCAASAAVVTLIAAARARMRGGEGFEQAFLAGAGLAVVYGTGLAELLDIGASWQKGPRNVAVSLYTLAVAGILLAMGFARAVPALRWVGLVGFSFVAIKVVAWDLAGVDTPYRILATGVLGLGLLGGAYAYARVKRREMS